MAASFGEQLRLAREARGISLREISEQTRISMRYLEAIEANDFKRLPGGIFNRSFIKAYARYIGYDEKAAIDGYTHALREQGETGEEPVSLPHKSHVYTDGGSTRSPFVTLLLSILILAILSLGVYGLLHWIKRREAARTAGNAPTATGQSGTAPATTAQPGASPSAATSTPQQTGGAPATASLNVQIKAVGDQVWLRVYKDDEGAKAIFAGNLGAEETKEFTPERSLRIQCSKVKVETLAITINGRPAKLPVQMKGSLAEMTVSKENYEQYLQ
jgi:cytoskeletal protein RodZ